jgi:TonB family protein
MRAETLLVLVLPFFTASVRPAFASPVAPAQQPAASADQQTNPAAGPPAIRQGLDRPVINGATNPELIPDESAIVTMIHPWARASADPSQQRQFESSTSRLKLSGADMKVLRAELARANPRLVELEAQVRASGGAFTTGLEPYLELRALMVEIYGRLLELLSRAGRESLQAHLQFIKTRTTVFLPGPRLEAPAAASSGDTGPAAPAAEAPARMATGIVQPRKVKDVKPIPPPAARGIGGSVVLEATIGVDGRVTSLRVLQSVPELDQAAIDAVRQWEYTPPIVNGTPTPIVIQVRITFAGSR